MTEIGIVCLMATALMILGFILLFAGCFFDSDLCIEISIRLLCIGAPIGFVSGLAGILNACGAV